jgi:hypothetical protein
MRWRRHLEEMATFLSLNERCRQDVRFFAVGCVGAPRLIGCTTKSRQESANFDCILDLLFTRHVKH